MSPWIPAILLLSFAVAARVLAKTWMAPSAFASGLWSVFVLVPMILTNYKIAPVAIWVIFALVGSHSIAAMLAEGAFKTALPLRVNWRKLILAGSIAAVFFVFVDSVRMHSESEDEFAFGMTAKRLEPYIFGYLPVFSYWADHAELMDPPHLAFGAYTFAGVFDSLGLKEREVGVYREVVTFGDPLNPVSTNLFTAFRGMIEDFSLIGAMLFCVNLGIWFGRAYRKVRKGVMSWAALLAICYAFWIWSPIVSLFTYNGSILALIVATVVFQNTRIEKPATQ